MAVRNFAKDVGPLGIDEPITPVHYHGWVPCFGGRLRRMFVVKRTRRDIHRQRLRGRRVVVKRWWKTQQACAQAMDNAGVKGFVRRCELGDECPEALDVLSN